MVELNHFDIIVTGARGLMGHALLQHLSSLSIPVKAFVRTMPDQCFTGVKYYLGSLPDQLPDFEINDNRKVIILHFASCLDSQDESQYQKVNVEGTEKLLKHLKGKIHTIVYASSMSVYGQGPFRQVNEAAKKCPETILAISRSKAEELVISTAREDHFNALLMRPRFILGKRDRSTFPALEKLTKYPFSISDESQKFSFIGIDDYAQLIISLIRKHLDQQEVVEAYNIAYSKPLELSKILDHLVPMREKREWKLPVRLIIPVLSILRIKRKLKTQLQLVGLDQILSSQKLQRALPDFYHKWEGTEEEIMKRLILEYREGYE